jgi:hypothetical protein
MIPLGQYLFRDARRPNSSGERNDFLSRTKFRGVPARFASAKDEAAWILLRYCGVSHLQLPSS